MDSYIDRKKRENDIVEKRDTDREKLITRKEERGREKLNTRKKEREKRRGREKCTC